jgi:hypothetical protein
MKNGQSKDDIIYLLLNGSFYFNPLFRDFHESEPGKGPGSSASPGAGQRRGTAPAPQKRGFSIRFCKYTVHVTKNNLKLLISFIVELGAREHCGNFCFNLQMTRVQ